MLSWCFKLGYFASKLKILCQDSGNLPHSKSRRLASLSGRVLQTILMIFKVPFYPDGIKLPKIQSYHIFLAKAALFASLPPGSRSCHLRISPWGNKTNPCQHQRHLGGPTTPNIPNIHSNFTRKLTTAQTERFPGIPRLWLPYFPNRATRCKHLL